ncbi:hypothetical protein BHM03_00039861 [Ensete ventricosum]|nr:hypothetical protein BHM03_00039861 [Ensete ventricosum]
MVTTPLLGTWRQASTVELAQPIWTTSLIAGLSTLFSWTHSITTKKTCISSSTGTVLSLGLTMATVFPPTRNQCLLAKLQPEAINQVCDAIRLLSLHQRSPAILTRLPDQKLKPSYNLS